MYTRFEQALCLCSARVRLAQSLCHHAPRCRSVSPRLSACFSTRPPSPTPRCGVSSAQEARGLGNPLVVSVLFVRKPNGRVGLLTAFVDSLSIGFPFPSLFFSQHINIIFLPEHISDTKGLVINQKYVLIDFDCLWSRYQIARSIC